eukprot:2770988-Rhodomonas_salina.1
MPRARLYTQKRSVRVIMLWPRPPTVDILAQAARKSQPPALILVLASARGTAARVRAARGIASRGTASSVLF